MACGTLLEQREWTETGWNDAKVVATSPTPGPVQINNNDDFFLNLFKNVIFLNLFLTFIIGEVWTYNVMLVSGASRGDSTILYATSGDGFITLRNLLSEKTSARFSIVDRTVILFPTLRSKSPVRASRNTRIWVSLLSP